MDMVEMVEKKFQDRKKNPDGKSAGTWEVEISFMGYALLTEGTPSASFCVAIRAFACDLVSTGLVWFAL